jgi:hypothetical protein
LECASALALGCDAHLFIETGEGESALTPALSPEERVREADRRRDKYRSPRLTRAANADGKILPSPPETALPLPGGKGRGEASYIKPS